MAREEKNYFERLLGRIVSDVTQEIASQLKYGIADIRQTVERSWFGRAVTPALHESMYRTELDLAGSVYGADKGSERDPMGRSSEIEPHDGWGFSADEWRTMGQMPSRAFEHSEVQAEFDWANRNVPQRETPDYDALDRDWAMRANHAIETGTEREVSRDFFDR